MSKTIRTAIHDTKDIEDEFVKMLVDEIQKETDFGVLSSVLAETGWTRVELPRLLTNEHAIDIHNWIDKHRTGNYHAHGSTFIFEKAQDAEWFILKWK